MHNKCYIHFFFVYLVMQLCSLIKNSELASISSFEEICISLNVKYVGLSSEVG